MAQTRLSPVSVDFCYSRKLNDVFPTRDDFFSQFMTSPSNPFSSCSIPVRGTTCRKGWPLCKDLPAVLFLDADLNVQPHHCVCWDFLWLTNSGQSYFQLLLSSPENRIFCWRIFFGFLHYDEKQRPTDQRWSCSSQRCQIKGSLLIKGIGLWINFILRAMNIYNKIFVQSSFVPVCVCVMGERITVVSTLKKAEKLIWMRCRKKNNKTKGTSVENHLCLTRGLHTLFDQEQ